ncbi:hypothetical protein CCP2SC5_1420001 [Azospirillaceae bacterium]
MSVVDVWMIIDVWMVDVRLLMFFLNKN